MVQPHNIEIPNDRPVYEGHMATCWFDEGILVFLSKSTLRTVDSIKPGLSRLIMNILLGLKKPPIPMKSFSDAQQARNWLNQYT